MLRTGPSDKSPSVGLIGGPTGCYTQACAACWLGYDHSKNDHAQSIAQHNTYADNYAAKYNKHGITHARGCGCGYKPAGEPIGAV